MNTLIDTVVETGPKDSLMSMLLINSGRKLTSRVVEKLERELECMLPIEYKQFLLEHNGGEPGPSVPCRFWISGVSKWQETVAYYYSVALTKKHGYLPFVWRRDLDYMPRQLLPIATTLDSRDPVYIGLGAGLGGKVFFSSSGRVPTAVTPMSTDADILADKGTIEVAGNFQEFLDSLF